MAKFRAIFPDARRNVSLSVRGVCDFDILNPCWDNRPTDIIGKHWGGGQACGACIEAAGGKGKTLS